MSNTTLFFRRLALTSYLLLIIWLILWHFVLSTEQGYSTLFIVLLWIVPILLPAPGLIKGNPYTHAWANFIIMIYLLHGLTSIYATADEWFYALIEIVLASTMFIGCCYFARFRGRELGLSLKKKTATKA